MRMVEAASSNPHEAFLTCLAGDRVQVRSAGGVPAGQVNPAVVEAMKETGIDICAEIPGGWPVP